MRSDTLGGCSIGMLFVGLSTVRGCDTTMSVSNIFDVKINTLLRILCSFATLQFFQSSPLRPA